MIKLGSAGKMGKGVFASQSIPAKHLIMTCYCWEISDSDVSGFLQTRWFENPWKKTGGLFVLGLISMLNHSARPNVEIIFSKSRLGYTAECFALTDLSKNTQLMINYGPNIWF